METDVLEKVSVEYGAPDALTRPLLKEAFAWVCENMSDDGTLDKSCVSAPLLAPFIRHISLFEFVIIGGKVTDFRAKVLASIVADNIFEISGRYGKENLPRPIFERWLLACQTLVDKECAFSTSSAVFGKAHRRVESLSVPVRDSRGILNHGLVFTDYWTA
ncbi:MAG: hypothetical protein HWE25_00585 [Alphaproteobacteria bacterium]|nr:hypothetical protein [Alphaproteobacteria bacterium]